MKISKLMNKILSQAAVEPSNAEEISKSLKLDLVESKKVIKQLEKMGLVKCFFQPTDFAMELIKLNPEKAD